MNLKSWKILKSTIDYETVNNRQIISNEFNNLFTSIRPVLADTNTFSVDTVINSIVISYVSYMNVKNSILSLKNSSPGYDEFPAFLAKDNLVVPLTYVINMSFMEGIFPSELKLAKIEPIIKSDESELVPNYRPLSV